MPDTFTSPTLLEFHVPGVLAVGATTLRRVVPFDYELVGLVASVNTAPTGASLIFDLLRGVNGTAQASLTTCWPVNPSKRPTILAGAFDQAAIVAGTTTVAPIGTDPALSGQSSGVSTTTTNYDELPYLAKPDPNSIGQGVSSGQPAGGIGEPFNTAPSNPVEISIDGGSSQESGGVPQLPGGGLAAFWGLAGDVLNLSVIQVGSTVAGADATVLALITRR